MPTGKFGLSPVPKDTWLYAFKSSVVKTQAYQAATLDVQQKFRYALLGGSERFPTARNRASDAWLAQLVPPDLSPEFRLDKGPAEFPTVGASFFGSFTHILANLKAS